MLGYTPEVELLHSTQFLDELLARGALALGQVDLTVTYHDPCDLGRKSDIYDAPRRVLQRIPGVELVEMSEHRDDAHCCGGGGNLESHDAELAAGIAGRRIRQAADTGAAVVVSACQQCERTLSNAARTNRIRMRTMDVSQLVLQAVQAAEREARAIALPGSASAGRTMERPTRGRDGCNARPT